MAKSKIKILYIITVSDTGGAQKYARDLQAHLDTSRFSSSILYGGKDINWLSNKSGFFFYHDIRALFELVALYKSENPDIIHLNSSKAGVIGAFAAKIANFRHVTNNKRHIRVIFTAHGWVFNPSNHLSWFHRVFYILLHKFAGSITHHTITVSSHDYHLALNHHIAPEDKLTVIHNGIDYDNLHFIDKVSARAVLTEKLKTENLQHIEDKQWIGSIGRLTKEKDYITLIKVAQSVKDAYFFIIGDGREKKNLQQITNNLRLTERFFFVSPTGEDAQYLKAFDIFALTSIKEGLPYILLEACAAKIPSVVTSAGGMPEIISDNESGYIVPLKNPMLFAERITDLIKNNAVQEKFSNAAYTRIQKEFSLKEMLYKTEYIYTKIYTSFPR